MRWGPALPKPPHSKILLIIPIFRSENCVIEQNGNTLPLLLQQMRKLYRMRKPKPLQPQRFWESLSDEQLLAVDLTTDDPENLEGVVFEIPPGDEEPYVEYKYDLRGSDREMLRCVHGNHPHLAGFVMRKDDRRFLVGHICGEKIYGENFERYTADFDAAVNRRNAAQRRREIEEATRPFANWLAEVSGSPVFNLYASVCDRMYEHMQWIYDNLPRAAAIGHRRAPVSFPPTLFSESADPEMDFRKAATECNTVILNLLGKRDQGISIDRLRGHFHILLSRIEVALDQLTEIEVFFQPSVLNAICDLANQHDNPKKRHYTAGLLEVTCKRGKNRVTVRMPRNFRVPDRAPLEAFRSALGMLAL